MGYPVEKRNLTTTSIHHGNRVQEIIDINVRGKTVMFLGHNTEEYIHEFVNETQNTNYIGKNISGTTL